MIKFNRIIINLGFSLALSFYLSCFKLIWKRQRGRQLQSENLWIRKNVIVISFNFFSKAELCSVPQTYSFCFLLDWKLTAFWDSLKFYCLQYWEYSSLVLMSLFYFPITYMWIIWIRPHWTLWKFTKLHSFWLGVLLLDTNVQAWIQFC